MFFLCPLAAGERMCYDSHSAYRRILRWSHAKAQGVGLQWLPPTTDAVHTCMTLPFFLVFLVFWRVFLCI